MINNRFSLLFTNSSRYTPSGTLFVKALATGIAHAERGT
jgi:hypothetical protein